MMDTTAPESLTLAVQSDENDDDCDDGCMSSQSSEYGDDGDMMNSSLSDDVTAQLAAAGWQKQLVHGDCFCCFYTFILTLVS